MYDKRAIWVVVGLATAAVLAGCASTKEGAGTFAGGPVAPTTASSSDIPTQPPTPTDSPSTSTEPSVAPTTDEPTSTYDPSNRTHGNVGIEDDGAICSLISAADLKQIFGETPHLFPDSTGPSCTYKNANGDQIIIGEYYNLVPSEQAKEDYEKESNKPTTIAGHPAIIGGSGDIYVAETKDINAQGTLEALITDPDVTTKISEKLLEKIVPIYAH
jgi:predicted small secreted protein